MSQVLAEALQDLEAIVENLVTEDDEPVDNLFSEKEQRLLTETLYSSWKPMSEEENASQTRLFFAAANVGVFFSVNEPPLVPDVFVSLDVKAREDMFAKRGRSYFVWEYGKVPEIVVEIVSNDDGGELDRKLKAYARKGIYYYVVHDPLRILSDDVLRVYEPGLLNHYRRREDYNLPDVGLSLTLWHGEFEGTRGEWLRWLDRDGNLLLTGAERADKLAAKLRELGVDPNQI
jgi:Uma2 family endonuclease